MDRRGFLHGSGAVVGLGGATLATTGCAGLADRLVPLDARGEPDIDETLETLDRVMLALASLPIPSLSAIVAEGRGVERQAAAVHVRRVLRSLMLVGTLRELPLEFQLHPGVQERTKLMLPELGEAVTGSRDLVRGLGASLGAAAPSDVKAALRRDPGLLLRAFEEVEREAAVGGVPLAHRLALRHAVYHVSFRLRQSPELLFHELSSKIERVEQRYDERVSQGREVAAHATEEALWREREALASAERRWSGKTVAKAPAWYASPAFAQVVAQAKPSAPGDGGWVDRPEQPSDGERSPPALPYPVLHVDGPYVPGTFRPGNSKARVMVGLGVPLLVIGLVATVAGAVYLSEGGHPIAGVAITLGVAAAIAGLVLLIVGGAKWD